MCRVRIDVFSDLGCPWCYIGEHRLERALRYRPDVEAEWHWRPFLLQPDLPEQGMPWATFVESKFGGVDRAQPMFERVTAAGAADGLTFDFGRMANAPSTIDAHRLILWAEGQGLQQELARLLFRAYFAEGRDLTDRETLVEAARAAGLDGEAARAWLAGSEGRSEVAASVEEARRLGITGVPFYVFERKYAISGAQPVEVFEEVIAKVVDEVPSSA